MKTRTTPEQRAELAGLVRGATPGPWTIVKPSRDADGWPVGQVLGGVVGKQAFYTFHRGGISPATDLRLLVASRNILPDLLADLEDALAEVAALEACKADDNDHRCEQCGEVIPGDGTEDSDWRTVCEDCGETMDEDEALGMDGENQ